MANIKRKPFLPLWQPHAWRGDRLPSPSPGEVHMQLLPIYVHCAMIIGTATHICALCNHIEATVNISGRAGPSSCRAPVCWFDHLLKFYPRLGTSSPEEKKLQNQIKLCKKISGWMMIIVRSDMWINMICCTAIGVYVPTSQQNKAYLILPPCPSMKRSFPAWKGKTGGSSSIWKGSHLCPLSVANTLLPIIGKGHLLFLLFRIILCCLCNIIVLNFHQHHQYSQQFIWHP